MEKTNEKLQAAKLQLTIKGKILAVEQVKTQNGIFFSNTIVIPAEDTYSKPTRIQVNSQMPIGREEEMVNGLMVNIVPQWRKNAGKWFFNCNLWQDAPGK